MNTTNIMKSTTLATAPTCSDKGSLLPILEEENWFWVFRGCIYLLGMIWCFFGVAIVSDSFMCGIEQITSKTRDIKIPDPRNPEGYRVIKVKVWNDTIANLSLLAFGTSAPEILLSVIETYQNNFLSGELGPGTIVGSAAFNLFCITALCIVSIPEGGTRRLKNMRVFGVTAFSNVFAYLWLIFVLMIASPKVVEVWEAVLTFLMFPGLLLIAYLADLGCRCGPDERIVPSSVEIGLTFSGSYEGAVGSAAIIDVAREIQKESKLSEENIASLLAATLSAEQPKPAGFYRVATTRALVGAPTLMPHVDKHFEEMVGKIRKLSIEDAMRKKSEVISDSASMTGIRSVVEFTCANTAVLENEGSVTLRIYRSGNIFDEIKIGVETIDGTAEAGADYEPMNKLVTFGPKETMKEIYIEIIDNNDWEPDEFFYVKLFYHPEGSTEREVKLGRISIAQVTIIDDDVPGKLQFSKPSYIVKQSAVKAQLTINRVNGADGHVSVKCTTKDMSARAGREYLGLEQEIYFEHGETSKILDVVISGVKSTVVEPNFRVELSEPTGGAEIGSIAYAIITIIDDQEFENMLSRIADKTQKNMEGLQLENGSWCDQFTNAMSIFGEDGGRPTVMQHVMHFITFFWKVLFAFIPPTGIFGGWLTFLLALFSLGVLTAIIADLASIFGCVLGMSDTITAITLVALGTSMPDMFASRSAAINEKYADSAIGNVNGSNSVNVFLGLGLPWLISTIYWHIKGGQLTVPTDSLDFSVLVFTVFAIATIALLLVRRNFKFFGNAELGGPSGPSWTCTIILTIFWITYIVLSSLQAQGVMTVKLGF